MPEEKWRVFHGTLCHSTEECPMEVLPNSVIGIKDKEIKFVGNGSDLGSYQDRFGFKNDDITTMTRGQMILPGFIDTHIHACQHPFCGTGFDKPLLDWLNTYTYPVENEFSNIEFAKCSNQKIVRHTLKRGTTTAQYFSSIHLEATLNLCQETQNMGQRAFIGKTAMDHHPGENGTCHYYQESTSDSIKDTERFVIKALEMESELIHPVVTPRFAISCTPALLSGLGDIAARYKTRIQSHLSENLAEIDIVKKMFPKSKSYTDVYKSHGLLTDKTVMAHGIHLSNEEMDMIVNNGTNVAAGHNISVASQIREAFTTSTSLAYMKRDEDPPRKILNYFQLFKMATLDGAKCLGIDDICGNFEVGKQFDAILANTNVKNSPIDIFPMDDDMDIVTKFLASHDDRNIEEVYVAGKKIDF